MRETLDFSARVQGVGLKPEELHILQAKEKELGITPDPEIETFLTVRTLSERTRPVHSAVWDRPVCAIDVQEVLADRGCLVLIRRRVRSLASASVCRLNMCCGCWECPTWPTLRSAGRCCAGAVCVRCCM